MNSIHPFDVCLTHSSTLGIKNEQYFQQFSKIVSTHTKICEAYTWYVHFLPSSMNPWGCSMFPWSPLRNVVLISIWWISMFLNGHQSRIQQIDLNFARSEKISLFIERWNCIEMKRREITWAECVTNFNHKTITCDKLIPTLKVSMCTQRFDRK